VTLRILDYKNYIWKPMRSLAADTSPEAEEFQIQLLRQASPAKRFRLVRSLCAMTRRLAWQGIRQANPLAPEAEIDLLFVSLHYGKELAASLDATLQPREKSLMIAEDILLAIRPVVDIFERLGIAYLIGGSVASSVYGVARSTLDADLSADVQFEHITPLVENLKDKYYISEVALREAIQQRSSFNLIHLDTMIKVDVFVLKDAAFDRAAFQRTRLTTLDQAEPHEFRLISPEDIVLRKLDWYRAGGSTSERQWLDILGVLRVQAGSLDRVYLQNWAAQLGLSQLLAQAWQDAGQTESN
jgi:hypothetical protein